MPAERRVTWRDVAAGGAAAGGTAAHDAHCAHDAAAKEHASSS